MSFFLGTILGIVIGVLAGFGLKLFNQNDNWVSITEKRNPVETKI